MAISNGLISQDTILTFGLAKCQITRLRDFIAVNQDGFFKIYIADEVTDLYAIPHFLAVLNFSGLSKNQEADYFAFWQECQSPRILTKEEILAIDDLELAEEIQRQAIMPLTFILNCSLKIPIVAEKLFVNKDIFAEQGIFNMLVGSEIKRHIAR